MKIFLIGAVITGSPIPRGVWQSFAQRATLDEQTETTRLVSFAVGKGVWEACIYIHTCDISYVWVCAQGNSICGHVERAESVQSVQQEPRQPRDERGRVGGGGVIRESSEGERSFRSERSICARKGIAYAKPGETRSIWRVWKRERKPCERERRTDKVVRKIELTWSPRQNWNAYVPRLFFFFFFLRLVCTPPPP